MDKETERRIDKLERRLDKQWADISKGLSRLERRVDKDWRMQNTINESATKAMTTLFTMNRDLLEAHERIEQIWSALEDQHDINQILTNRLFMLDLQPAKGTH